MKTSIVIGESGAVIFLSDYILMFFTQGNVFCANILFSRFFIWKESEKNGTKNIYKTSNSFCSKDCCSSHNKRPAISNQKINNKRRATIKLLICIIYDLVHSIQWSYAKTPQNDLWHLLKNKYYIFINSYHNYLN